MKTFRSFLVTALIAGFGGSAQAATIEIIDTFVPESTITLSGNGDNFGFSHYLALPSPLTNTLEAYVDGVPGAGYDSTTDTLTSGTLTLYFTSCTGVPCTNGKFDLSLGGFLQDDHNFSTTVAIDHTQFDLALITVSGQLTVLMTRTNAAGTVTFLSSILNVSGVRTTENGNGNGTPIPEPAMLALLGVAAMTASSRLRRPAR